MTGHSHSTPAPSLCHRLPGCLAFAAAVLLAMASLLAMPSPAWAAGACATANACGGQSPQGCWCDDACDAFHDCCSDVVTACRVPKIDSITPATGPTNGVRIQILGSRLKGSDLLPDGNYASVDLRSNPNISGPPCAVASALSSDSTLVCDVPAGVGQNYQVHVATQRTNYQGTFLLDGLSAAPAVFSYNPPTINSVALSDDASAAGTGTLTLTGTNFGTTQGSVSVSLNGQTLNCPLISQDDTSIQCSLPALTGDGDWTVQATVGQQSSNVMALPPHLVSVSPASAWVGDSVTLSGINFGPSPAITVAGVDWGLACLSHTHTSISCAVPQGVGQNLEMRVTAAGQSSNTRLFSYGPPQITGLTPTSGRTAGGYPVTLLGRGFGTSGAIVFAGGSALSGSQVTAQANDQLTFIMPEGEIRAQVSVGVLVQNSNSVTFTYAAPLITGAIRFIDNGQAKIEIDGDNFGLTGSASINGVGCSALQHSHTQIVCALPPGGGAVPVVVTVGTLLSNTFTFNYPPPTVSGISPQTGDTAGTYTLTVAGTNFASNPSVTVGGRLCVGNGPSTSTQIPCTVPAGQGANLDVVVQSDAQTATSPVKFSYNPPAVSTVAPATAAAGTVIAIDGSNFGLTPTVSIGGQDCPLAASGNTHAHLSCTVPPGGGLAQLVVTVQGQSSAPFAFNYPPPTITSISPKTGDTVGGYTLTVAGTNFSATPLVTVGGNTCVGNGPATSTQILCTVPPGEGTDRAVVVFSGSQFGTSPVKFSYNPPAVSTVAPATAAAGTVIAIDGGNFGLSPVVAIGGQSCALVASGNTHTHLSCTVPPGGGVAQLVVTVQGQSSAPFAFNYPPPTVSGISPQTGDTAGTYTLTVAGTNFAPDAAVTVGGQTCPVSTKSATQLACAVPVGQGANLDVLVVQSGNQPAASPAKFSYNPPTVGTVMPATAAVGKSIAIDGSNFGLTPTVTIGGQACALAASGNTHTHLSCTVPQGTGKNLEVRVAVAGQTSNAGFFSYLILPELRIEATVSSGQPAVGLPFTYALTVTDSGGPTTDPVQIVDIVPSGVKLVGVNAPGGWTCTPTVSPAQSLQGGNGAMLTCDFVGALDVGNQAITLTAVPTAATGRYTNVATISGDGQTPTTTHCDGSASANCGQVDITPSNPRLELVQKLTLSPTDEIGTPDGRAQAGEKLTHSFTLANRGDVALSPLALADVQLDGGSLGCAATTALGKAFGLTGSDSVLAVGDSVVCTGQHTVTVSEDAAGRIEDSATATGKAPDGTPWQSTANAAWDNAPPSGQFSLFGTARHNDANGDGKFDQGETVSRSFIVRNVGSLPLGSLVANASDPLFPLITCPSTLLATGTQAICTVADAVLTLADETAGQVASTVTATAVDADGHGIIATDTGVLNGGQSATLELKQGAVLSADLGAPGLTAGDTLTYTQVATNTGGLPLADVTITDSKLGAALQANGACSPAQGGTLNPGSGMVCTADYTVQTGEVDPIDNTAHATAKPVGRNALVDASSTHVVPYAQSQGPTLYTIGDRVWLDNDNGVLDTAEKGIDGVVVSLQLGDGTVWGQAKYADNSPIPDQVTAGGGYYQFANVPQNLAGSMYRVMILLLNFKSDITGTKPLYGASSSYIDDSTAFPWADGHDQGIGTSANATNGIVSRAFDLASLPSGTTAFNSADFGFVKANITAPPDLVITNTASAAAVGLNGTLTYTLQASNAVGSGNLTKAPIIIDKLPTGMTVAGTATTLAASNWSCAVSSNRQTVTCIFKGTLPLAGGADIGGAVAIPVSVGPTTATGPVTDTATITKYSGEPSFANNAASVIVNVTP